MGRKGSAYTKNIKRNKYKKYNNLRLANERRTKLKEERQLAKKLSLFQNVDEDTQNAGPSTQVQDETQHIKEQEVCVQIKSSLQKLRRKSNPEPDKPMLELEVFPEHVKQEIHIDDTLGFVDESQPMEEVESGSESKQATKRKIDNLLRPVIPKKVKRNPRRHVVIKRIQEEAIKAALNAPVIEKVFVDTPKPEDKKVPTDTADVPTSLEQKEQLYEFGKFVAEQLMTFNQKDVQEAQTEIKEVLKKYRLKYKILNCLTKTSSSEPPATNNMTVSNGHAKTKPEPKQGSKTVQPAAQKSSILLKAALLKAASANVSKAPTQVKSTAKVTKPYSGKAQLAQEGTSTSAKQPAVQTPALPNMKLGTGDIPLSLVLVPSEDGSLKLTTARVDSTGTIMTFPNAPRVNIEAIPPNLTHPVIPGSSTLMTTQPVPKLGVGQQSLGQSQMPQTSGIVQQSQQVLTNTVSQPDNSRANIETASNTQNLIDDPNLGHGIPLDPLKVEPSETIDEDCESESESHKETVSVIQTEAETVVFKCEKMSSDEEC